MAPHSSTPAWKIPWMEEPGGLQSMGSRRVGHDWVTSLSLFLSCFGEGNGNPLQCSCLENPRDGGAWWAAVYGVAQSQTRLKWLSSSSQNPWICKAPLYMSLKQRLFGCFDIFYFQEIWNNWNVFVSPFFSLINLPSQCSSCQWELWYFQKFIFI